MAVDNTFSSVYKTGEIMVEDYQENYVTGWIKIFRSIRSHWIWKDPIKFQWWVDILLEVNHSDKKVAIGYKIFDCKKGESLNSLVTWGNRWGVSKSVVNNFLRMLEQDGMITTNNETVTKRITVCNYKTYQQNQNGFETQGKRKKTEQFTNKNEKNEKNKYIDAVYFKKDKDIDSAFKDYLKLRIKSKYTMTDRAINALVNKLRELSDGNKKLALKIIDNAILGKWKSFYNAQ